MARLCVYHGYAAFTHRHHYPRLHEHDIARERDTARFALISAIHNDSSRAGSHYMIALHNTTCIDRAQVIFSYIFINYIFRAHDRSMLRYANTRFFDNIYFSRVLRMFFESSIGPLFSLLYERNARIVTRGSSNISNNKIIR